MQLVPTISVPRIKPSATADRAIRGRTGGMNNYNSPPRRRRYPYIGNRASLEFVEAPNKKPCLCRVQYARVMTRRQRTEPTRYARKLRDADL